MQERKTHKTMSFFCSGPARQGRGEKQRECGKGSRVGEDRTDTEKAAELKWAAGDRQTDDLFAMEEC